MTFFYSGLSILFLSGILLISKHAMLFLNLNNVDYQDNLYKSSKYQIIDKYILKTLRDGNLKNNDLDLCYNIKERLYSESLISESDYEYFVFDKTLSDHPLLINSCILSDGKHRILIKNNLNTSKNIIFLNSCILFKNNRCSFEDK